MHADRADGEALIGAADHVHGDGVGIGGERFAAEAVAPGLELPPGRAVGAAGAVAAGAGGIDRGAAGQLLEFGGAGGAVGHGERAEQGGLQDQGSPSPGSTILGVGRTARRGRRPRGWVAQPGRGGGTAPAGCHPMARSLARSAADRRRGAGSARPGRSCGQSRTSVLRPQSRIIGRNSFPPGSRVRERSGGGRAKTPEVTNRSGPNRRGPAMLAQRYQRLGEAPPWPGDAVRRPRTTMTPCSGRPGRTPRTKPTPTGAASRAPRPAGDRPRQRSRPGHLAVRRRRCAGLLVPLCDATDALARLDARAAAAPERARRAASPAWPSPRPPAGSPTPTPGSIRSISRCATLGLTARTALAAVGAGHRALPQTFAGPADAARLGSIRRSRRWPTATAPSPTRWPRPAAAPAAPGNTGGSQVRQRDRSGRDARRARRRRAGRARLFRLVVAARAEAGVRRRRSGSREGEGGDPPLPPLLLAAQAAHRLDGGRHHRAPGARPRAARRDRPGRPRRRHPRRVPPGLGGLSGRRLRRSGPPAEPAQRCRRSPGRPRPAGHLAARVSPPGGRERPRRDCASSTGSRPSRGRAGGSLPSGTSGRGCRTRSTRCCACPC